jgi:microcystin-dependent protein
MFTDPYYAQVTIFAGNFAPRKWAFCNGQLMSIAQNTALFALLGTTFGGNGQTTFGLPDLRGRAAIHIGQGAGLTNIDLGEMAGTESMSLLNQNMPVHTHSFVSATGGQPASTTPGVTDIPTNNYPAPVNGSGNAYSTSPSAATMGVTTSNMLTPITGGSQPFDIRSPFLVMNYIICTEGIFPARN